MNQRSLPIQLVETRGEIDLFLKEGMGDNSLPNWSTQESMAEHVRVMTDTFSAAEQIFDSREEEGLPILLVATLDENAARRKAFRANARSIFDSRQKRNVLGKESHQGLLVKVDSKADIQLMRNNINISGNISKDKQCGVAVIDNLQLFHPYVEDDLVGKLLKVKLVDYQNQRLNELARQSMQRFAEQNHVVVRSLDYSPGLHLFAVERATQDAIQALATMDAVISVKKMPYFELTVSPEPYNTNLEVKEPVDGEEYPLVGLLDSGVEAIPHLAPWLDAEENTAGLVEADIRRLHGTSVAGVINYGDALEGELLTGTSPMKIRSCIVNTDDRVIQMSEEEMVGHIKTAIVNNPDVHVWNLSQGSTNEVENDDFSDFAIALDSMQKEYGILICKSAGNISSLEPDKKRISQGADSVLALTVGSIAHKFVTEGDALIGTRSPFSRIGPGPAEIIKPDIVHAGGNQNIGVNSFSDTGYQGNRYSGTSYSTPRVSALAASLEQRLNRPFNPLLIKALLIHSAEYPHLPSDAEKSLFNELGFGRPALLDEILFNNPNEFTMVWQPVFQDGVDLQIQDIPFPSSLVEDGYYTGEVTVTLVTSPVLRSVEKSEYCQSDVKVALTSYTGIRFCPLGAAGTPPTYKNSERLIDPENVLTKSRYSKPSFRKMVHGERTIICGEDYSPVKKYHVNLQQMTPAEKDSCLGSDRRWCLSLEATYKDATATDKSTGINVGNVEAVVVITIRDPREQGVLYDKCIQALEEHNFVHSDIAIRQNINVANE